MANTAGSGDPAETIAQQRGYCKMTLEVLQANQSAQALYRKVGFAGYTLDPSQGQALFWQKLLQNQSKSRFNIASNNLLSNRLFDYE